MNKTPMEALFEKVDWKCAICGGPARVCGCWETCDCGWHFEKGEKCRNPIHEAEEVKP